MASDYDETLNKRGDILKQLSAGMMILEMFNMESIPFILCVFDLNTLKFKQISKSCFPILGYTVEEMESKIFSEFVMTDEDIKRSIKQVDDNLIHGEIINAFKNTYYHADGIHAVNMTWFGSANNSGLSFNFGIPGKKLKIENG